MDIYPAIDIQDGKCVNLVRGDFARSTVFDESPVNAAVKWAKGGSKWLHVVDLDGARAGRPINGDLVRQICDSTGCQIQFGGGIRNLQHLEDIFELGVTRAVLSTVAVEDLDLVGDAARWFPGRIAIGLDTRAGKVATHAWTNETEILATDLAIDVTKVGAAALIHTDINLDGMLTGANINASIALSATVNIPVIVSGGISSLEDVRQAAKAKLGGVIIGRALYLGTIDLRSALETARDANL